jgi:ATP-binding protein involved in chromosome partitioning
MHPSFVGGIRQRERLRQKLAGIRHKIGIYSAKGGVGKTTVAVNMAYALSRRGFRVGLLDADIDTPNISLFLGIDGKMEPTLPLKPLDVGGIKVASTAMLAESSERPIIWRGPMIVKMLGEFFENTDWGELDYLLIDLSPGTSDAPLTIMQILELDGFVIVTTPQRVAGINSMRSGLMAKRLNAAILGVVENMSEGEPSESTKRVAEALNAGVLGTIRLNAAFDLYSDAGKVAVFEDPSILEEFDKIVERVINPG